MGKTATFRRTLLINEAFGLDGGGAGAGWPWPCLGIPLKPLIQGEACAGPEGSLPLSTGQTVKAAIKGIKRLPATSHGAPVPVLTPEIAHVLTHQPDTSLAPGCAQGTEVHTHRGVTQMNKTQA